MDLNDFFLLRYVIVLSVFDICFGLMIFVFCCSVWIIFVVLIVVVFWLIENCVISGVKLSV